MTYHLVSKVTLQLFLACIEQVIVLSTFNKMLHIVFQSLPLSVKYPSYILFRHQTTGISIRTFVLLLSTDLFSKDLSQRNIIWLSDTMEAYFQDVHNLISVSTKRFY